MKIKKIYIKKNKIVKINIIKTKLYKKINNPCLNLNDIIFRFKQALQIIYNNKKILFVGFPDKIENKFQILLQNTNHVLIPSSFWMNGIITNPKKCVSYIFKNQKFINPKISKILFLLNTKVDLIVLLNSVATKNILNESYHSKIPIVSLTTYFNIFDSRSTYKIPGDSKFSIKNPRNNFFYMIIYSLFKQAHQNKISDQFKSLLNSQKKSLISNFLTQKLVKQKNPKYNKYKKNKNFQTFN